MKRVPLTKGKFAIVDDEDYERVMTLKWHACMDPKNGVWYAKHTRLIGKKKWQTIQMHKFVLKESGRHHIDHRNRDGLDNQKSNLRSCKSASMNVANCTARAHTSPYKGVDFNSVAQGKKWRAQIAINGKKVFLGRFDTPEKAAFAYDSSAAHFFGQFARTNQQMGLL